MKTTRKTACTALLACALAGGAAAEEPAQGPEGFRLTDPSGAWELELHALIQLDGRWFADDSAPDDDNEWLLRRVRPSLQGALGERLAFRIVPDFGNGDAELIDAYVDTALGGGFSLRAGRFKPPVGLERLQSSESLRLVERSFVTELLPNRDVGLALSGGGKRLGWSVGLFNGVDDGRSGDQDDDGNQELAARLFGEPFGTEGPSTFGIGIAATWGSTDGTTSSPLLSGYRSPGQNTVFSYRGGADGTFADGERLRVTPQFYWYRGPVGVLGEWARVRQDVRRDAGGSARRESLDHEAWQLTAEWFVTGHAAGYRDPEEPGSVQLVARIARLVLDDAAFAGGALSFADPAAAVRRARTWGAGVNWRPMTGLKASLAATWTSFDGGAAGGDRPDEKAVFLRLQQAF